MGGGLTRRNWQFSPSNRSRNPLKTIEKHPPGCGRGGVLAPGTVASTPGIKRQVLNGALKGVKGPLKVLLSCS